MHAHDAGAVERGIEHIVGTDQRAGMRYGCAAALGEAACFHHDNGFGARGCTQGTHEAPRLVDALDVEHDGVGRRIDHQVVENLPEIDVGRDAARDDTGETDIARACPVEHGGAHRAGLRHQRNLPGLRHALAERGIEFDVGTHDTQAVRPDEANSMPPCRIEHRLLECEALFAGLAKAGGEDHRRGHAARAAVLQHVGHGHRRRHDDRKIDRLFEIP